MRIVALTHKRPFSLRNWFQQRVPTSTMPPSSGWHHPLVGYIVALLSISIGLGIGILETQLLSPLSFPGLPLLFAVVFVALFWGVGPAAFAILLSLLVLDYFYVPPFGTLSGYGWNGLVQLLSFVAAGIVIAILAHQREITRVRAVVAEREALLRAHELEATFDAMSDGVVVYNQQGNVVETNAAVRSLFGISALHKSEQEQRQEQLLLQAVQCNEQGETLPLKRQPLFRLLAGESLTGNKAIDVLVRTADGRNVVFNLSGASLRSASGKRERAIVIYRDVTERRQLEQRTEQALQALLAMTHVLVQLPTPLTSNEGATETGITEEVGQKFAELTMSVVESRHVVMLAVEPENDSISPVAAVGFTPLQEEMWREKLVEMSSLIHAIGNELLVSHLQDGEVMLLDGMSLPLYTHVFPYYVQTVLVAPIIVRERLVGLLCVDNGGRDHTYTAYEMTLVQTVARLASLILTRTLLLRENTEARANELALRESNRRMEEFLSIVCHELKSPITVARGSLQLAERKVQRLLSNETFLADELKRFASIQTLLERAIHSTALQDRLVNDLLDVSRIQVQTLRLYRTPCNLVSILHESIEAAHQVQNTCIIHLDIPFQSNVLVDADADRIAQVMTNFLTNAMKYSPSDRPVRVHLSIEGQEARVSVQDEGPGLIPSEQERIWERFYRSPGIEAHNGSDGGLGVGLHLCRAIIEQHGGRIGVHSTVGQGSTFWFALPLVEQESEDKISDIAE